MMVASQRKSINKVFKRVVIYGFGRKGQKRSNYEIQNKDETREMVQIGAKMTKNVLILMSDIDGGHGAS
ncbi:unnamed protein product, partial [Ilex paraguariensis]